MKRKQHVYYFRMWLNKLKAKCEKFMIPLIIFQATRTLIFPSILDFFILFILICVAISFHFQWM